MPDNADAYEPRMDMNADGDAVVVWKRDDGNSYIWSNRYTAGVGWGTAEIIDDTNYRYDQKPDVTIDPDGNAIAVWLQYEGTLFIDSVWANHYQ